MLDLDGRFQQAIELHRANRLDQAESAYREILAVDTAHPDANHNLAVILLGTNRAAEAVPLLEKALSTNPHLEQYWLTYINAIFSVHGANAALETLQRAQQTLNDSDAISVMEQRLLTANAEADLAELSRDFAEAAFERVESKAAALLQQQPRLGMGWKILAVARQQQGSPRTAEALENALRLMPGDYELYNNHGVFLRGQGLHDLARESYSRSLQINPGYVDARVNLANLLAEVNDLEAAELHYAKALEEAPDHLNARNNFGNLLKSQSRFEEAEQQFLKALALSPDQFVIINNLGVIYSAQDRVVEAEARFERAIELAPDYAEARLNLGQLLARLARWEQAEQQFKSVLSLRPEWAETHNDLGNLYLAQRDYPRAEASFLKALELAPQSAMFLSNYGNLLKETGRINEARTAFKQANDSEPGFADAFYNLGVLEAEYGESDAAASAYLKALEINLEYAEAHNNLGVLLKNKQEFSRSLQHLTAAQQLQPGNSEYLSNLGVWALESGNLDAAQDWFNQSIALNDKNFGARSNLLFLLNYLPDIDADARFKAAVEFGELLEADVQKSEEPFGFEPQTVLKIGLVSADLRKHPVSYFLLGVLEELIRKYGQRIEVHAFSNSLVFDDYSRAIAEVCSSWHGIRGRPDREVKNLIRSLGIEILIDLSGHTAENRLALFASRAAPVQVSWLGYFATTGLTQMDYLLTDTHSSPPGAEAYFTEELIRFPATRMCFTPPEIENSVLKAASAEAGSVTFGSFGNLAKLNEEVLQAWSRIMENVSSSRLLIKANQLDDSSIRERLMGDLTRAGVDTSRIVLDGRSELVEYYKSYQSVDIVLDTFPFSGGTTTCDALSQGVPVVTLAGDSIVSRQGACFLANCGLDDWVADSKADYVDIATRMSADPRKLSDLRECIKSRFQDSPITDSGALADHLFSVLKDLSENRRGN